MQVGLSVHTSVVKRRIGAAAGLAAILLSLFGSTVWLLDHRSAHAAPPATEAQDAEEREFRRDAARAMVRDNCLICHSEELISGQRLTQMQWKAEVDKMVGWGAPLSLEQVEPLVEFLAGEYSETTPPPAPVRAPATKVKGNLAAALDAGSSNAAGIQRGAALYRAHC